MNKPSIQSSTPSYNLSSLSENLSVLNLLRPAGAQLILEDEETTFFDYLRLTFSDLLLKRVVEVEVIRKKAHHRDKRAQSYYMIKPGSNYRYYQPAPFEKTFLNALNQDGSVLLKFYVANVFNESPRDKRYKKNLVAQLNLAQYVHTGPAFHLFKKLSLNNRGKAFKQEIQNYIFYVNLNLNEWIANEPDKVMEALSVLGGNVFLIPELDNAMWNKICSVAKEYIKTGTITLSSTPDLQELTPSYFRPEIYPIVSYFYERIEQLVGYNGVFSGVGNSSDWGGSSI